MTEMLSVPTRTLRAAASVAVALALLVGPSFGGFDRAAAKKPGELIETKTLENGLTVIAIPDPSLPIATIEMALRHGAFAESPEFDGLSHLYEHMFFKGNAEIPDQEAYLERMKELGIDFNGTTSTERVNYFFTLPRRNLEKGMVFMEHAIRSPKFDSEEFEKEKKIVLSEYDRAESHPRYAFDRAMQRMLWYEYPSRKITLGSRDAIANATVEQMRAIKEQFYVPNNAALLISGDVRPKRAFELAEKVYGDWKAGADPFEADPVPEHPPLDGNKYLVQEGDVKVPTIDFRWHGPSVDEDREATYAADVLSFILSQPSSAFQETLVESNIALNADVSYYTQRHTGPITASARVPAENIEKAIETLLRELHKIDDPDYFSDRQLENAKSILEARDVYSREKTSSFTHTVSFWWAVDDVDYYLNYIDNLNAVTREDIVEYVDEYILDDPYVAGALLGAETREELGLDEEKLEEIVESVEEDLEVQAETGTDGDGSDERS